MFGIQKRGLDVERKKISDRICPQDGKREKRKRKGSIKSRIRKESTLRVAAASVLRGEKGRGRGEKQTDEGGEKMGESMRSKERI